MGRLPTSAVAAPALFVVLWATGFVVAREGLRYTDPATLVAMRFGVAASLLAVVAVAAGARRPSRREAAHSAVVGLLLQLTYVLGVFAALDHRLAAGVTALVTGLQPLLTAGVVGPLLKEHVTWPRWAGLVVGFGGVALVVERKVHFHGGAGTGLAFAVAGLVGITAGTLYQRRFLPTVDLRAGMSVQYATGAVASLALAASFEPLDVRWTWQLGASLAWMSVVLSVGTYLAFLWLVRRGDVARVTSLFYLVPPVTALMAWPWFGERVTAGMAVGMALAAAGVAIVQRSGAPGQATSEPRRATSEPR